MGNIHLYQLINASPGIGPLRLAIAMAVAQWLIYALPVAMIVAWARADLVTRRELLNILMAAMLSLALAQLVGFVWPQPRPAALHLGIQYLQHAADPGLPSDHVTVFWSLGIAALMTRRLAIWGLPLLALGLIVGWSRVYLGVHFPLDVLAALPVAVAGAAAASALRRPTMPLVGRLLYACERLEKPIRQKLDRSSRP